MSAELDELIAEAEIGLQAKTFMETDLGKCLLGMADQDAEAARIAMEDVDPLDSKAIMKLQNKIALARNFKSYLIELFDRGEQAIARYRHEQT